MGLTKVRESVIDDPQVIPAMAGHSGKVLSTDGNLPRWVWGRIVGELARFSFDTPPDGFFALDGSLIVNGKNDFSELVASGSRFITVSGNDLILKNFVDFGRGKGASSRAVGQYEEMDIQSHAHRQVGGGYQNGGSSGAYGDGGRFTVWVEATGGVETRPKSFTELACIYHGVI